MSVVNVQTPPVFQHTAARRRLENTGVTHITTITFQHTAARRRLAISLRFFSSESRFQHTAARRRLGRFWKTRARVCVFQHTAARRRLVFAGVGGIELAFVSTHSRPKAAGSIKTAAPYSSTMFQHTAARRRLAFISRRKFTPKLVSTHSRPKAAGASLKSLAPSGFAALISLSSQEKREREYNTAFSVTPAFAIS